MSEFTLRDITDAMHSGRKITNCRWVTIKFIYFVNGMWLTDSQNVFDHFDFCTPEDWSFYKEPKKTVKKTYYKAYITTAKGYIYTTCYYPNKSDLTTLERTNIIGWEEKEFEIPVEGGE